MTVRTGGASWCTAIKFDSETHRVAVVCAARKKITVHNVVPGVGGRSIC